MTASEISTSVDDFATRPVLCDARDVQAYAQRVFSDFDGAFAAAPIKMRMAVAGQDFEFATNLPDQAEIYKRSIAHRPSTQNDADQSVRVLIASGYEFPSLPTPPVWHLDTYNDHRMCRDLEPTSTRLHHFQERDFWQFYDRDMRRGAQILPTPACLPDWDSGSPLRNFMNWYFASETSGIVHSGTLGVDGKGLMFAGAGGSGKSGTVISGLFAGLDSVGDDYILAKTDGSDGPGGVSVHPVFNTLKTDQKGVERIGLTIDGPTNWQNKYQVTFQSLFQKDPVQELSIQAMCLPTVTGENTTTFEPVSRREAYLGLAKTGFMQMPGDTKLNLVFCSDVIRRLPTFRMRLGTDAKEVADKVAEFIEQRAKAC